MKEIVPTPPPLVHNAHAEIRDLFARYVVPSYGRFDLALSHGSGSEVWDVSGRRYLDLGGGIAVCSLGHANSEITEALVEQSRKLVHVSNLYYQAPQGNLAERLVRLIGPGRVFFCNSGAEANEGLYKAARKFGHDEGRFEILTAWNSFHGRTLGGISATGQEKVKKGFEPLVPGFRHIPFNDLAAATEAISPATVAILIEGIQGEGGITPATAEYLLGLRRLCDERRLLLLVDGVQCGHFRSGEFQSFQRILSGVPGAEGFLPDGIAMAKSLGGGFPMGAFWLRETAHGVRFGEILGPGTHGTTYGGTPLGCAVALRILDVVERDGLAAHVRATGDWLHGRLEALVREFPTVARGARGLGFMQGIELQPREGIPGMAGSDKAPSMQAVLRLHEAGVLTIPSGNQIVRLLPALNIRRTELEEGVERIAAVLRSFA
ncbi:MAG: aminotransferase class III-fold pyridoxal phosphate-dependent enzyme [Verrucomicrobia bacterium]|nr:MAG: aminotransferase class III-fold pyridoxal phosphate-dependent enzyme [Verrucomicrobiota bacterium]